MIRIVLTILMSLGAFLGFSQDDKSSKSTNEVEITINNIGTDKGTVYYMIFNSEESFNKRNALQSSYSKINDGKTSVEFKDLKAGNYAVLCFHDVNGNNEMDFLDNGIPQERYGLTNNTINYGPPSFADAKFEVKDTNLTFEIELIQVL